VATVVQHDFARDASPIAVLFVQGQPDHPIHGHGFTELVLVTRGSATHVVGGHRVAIAAGDAFVIVRGIEHGYEEAHDFDIYNVLFQEEALGFPILDIEEMPGYRALFREEPELRASGRAACHLRLTASDLAVVVPWVQELDRGLTQKDAGYRFKALVLLLEIIGRVSRAYSELEHPQPRALVRVSQATQYIDAHLGEEIRILDLARRSGLSESSLLRSFQQAFDCTPVEYILGARVARAKSLLERTNLSMTDVAVQVGLSDSSHFSRTFRRLVGKSPSEYRRELEERRATERKS